MLEWIRLAVNFKPSVDDTDYAALKFYAGDETKFDENSAP